MKARMPDEHMAFYLAIERAAPQVWRDLADLAAARRAEGARVSRGDVSDFLKRWGLDPACSWLSDDVLLEARSEPVGVPSTSGIIPTHDQVLSLSWEPGETGETRTAFKDRAEAALRLYMDRVDAWLDENAIELPPQERDRGEAPDGLHRWDMLVSRLVLGQTYQQIGDDLGISPQGAARHVKALAERLGLAL